MADFDAPRDFHDVPRAFDVRTKIGLWIFQAVAHANLCGEVDQNVGLGFQNGRFQCWAVLEHRDDGFEGRKLGECRMAHLLELDVVIGSEAIEACDVMPFLQQAPGQMKTDKAKQSL